MAEDTHDLEAPEAAEAIEKRAYEIGWRPKEKYLGDPDKWVDAKTFVERGEHVIPIMKANNIKLRGELAESKNKIDALEAAVAEMRGSMNNFVEMQAAMAKEKLEGERKALRAQLREARAEGNDDKIEQIEDQLDELKEVGRKLAAEKKEPAAPAPPPASKDPPEFAEWRKENAWFGKDRRRTALAIAIAQDLEKERTDLKGTEFFEELDRELEKVFPHEVSEDPGKVEDGRPSRQPPRGGFDSLPPEAKARARADASKFVGPNKLFKTEKEWFAEYTRLYNQ